MTINERLINELKNDIALQFLKAREEDEYVAGLTIKEYLSKEIIIEGLIEYAEDMMLAAMDQLSKD